MMVHGELQQEEHLIVMIDPLWHTGMTVIWLWSFHALLNQLHKYVCFMSREHQTFGWEMRQTKLPLSFVESFFHSLFTSLSGIGQISLHGDRGWSNLLHVHNWPWIIMHHKTFVVFWISSVAITKTIIISFGNTESINGDDSRTGGIITDLMEHDEFRYNPIITSNLQHRNYQWWWQQNGGKHHRFDGASCVHVQSHHHQQPTLLNCHEPSIPNLNFTAVISTVINKSRFIDAIIRL